MKISHKKIFVSCVYVNNPNPLENHTTNQNPECKYPAMRSYMNVFIFIDLGEWGPLLVRNLAH